jgi:hypothetical protein
MLKREPQYDSLSKCKAGNLLEQAAAAAIINFVITPKDVPTRDPKKHYYYYCCYYYFYWEITSEKTNSRLMRFFPLLCVNRRHRPNRPNRKKSQKQMKNNFQGDRNKKKIKLFQKLL